MKKQFITKQKFLLLFILLITSTSTSLAQGMRGGGMGRGGQNGGMRGGGMHNGPIQQNSSTPIDLIDACGMFLYDADEIIKKCKVKEANIQDSIRNTINIFQRAYDNTTFLYADNLSNIRSVQQTMKGVEGNREMLMECFRAYNTHSQLVRKEMTKEHKKLDKAIFEILTEKQQKKWKTYLSSLYEEKSFRTEGPRGKNSEVRQRGRPSAKPM